MSHTEYDFIGDVHGKADKLKRLLSKLGYREVQGVWRHPSRVAVFVGDLVDRGAYQVETITLVRRMCDAGAARCVMGNHEFNAIAWTIEDPSNPGHFFRKHLEAHRLQHADFLAEVAHDKALHADIIGWFKTLPLLLELGPVRVAHACWDERHSAEILKAVDPRTGSLTEATLLEGLTKGTALYEAIEVVTKGPEARLPQGASYVDNLGKTRHTVRVAWWQPERHIRGCALPMPGLDVEALPHGELAADVLPSISEDHLHVFGHYWMSGVPRVLTPRLVSVDYHGSEGYPLTAYRWSGEPELNSAHFVQTH